MQQRSIVAPEFVGKRLEAFSPAIGRTIDALIMSLALPVMLIMLSPGCAASSRSIAASRSRCPSSYCGIARFHSVVRS